LSVCSTIIECLQFGPAFLAESPQRIAGVALHQKCVSMIKWTTASAFSITAELDTTRIRLISA
jgi:hypothetical protein